MANTVQWQARDHDTGKVYEETRPVRSCSYEETVAFRALAEDYALETGIDLVLVDLTDDGRVRQVIPSRRCGVRK